MTRSKIISRIPTAPADRTLRDTALSDESISIVCSDTRTVSQSSTSVRFDKEHKYSLPFQAVNPQNEKHTSKTLQEWRLLSYDVTPCCLVDRYRSFRVAFCLHIQGGGKECHNHGWTTFEISQKFNNDRWLNSCFVNSSVFFMPGFVKHCNIILMLWSSRMCECIVSQNTDQRGSIFVRNHLRDSQSMWWQKKSGNTI